MVTPLPLKIKPPQLQNSNKTNIAHQNEQEKSNVAIGSPEVFKMGLNNIQQNNIDKKNHLQHNFNNILIHPNGGSIQTKLSVNTPGDKYEQEADDVANKIMQMPANSATSPHISHVNTFQYKYESQENVEKKKKQEYKNNQKGDENLLQRKESNVHMPAASANVNAVLQSTGQSMDKGTRSFMENRFGFDFSKVQIHNNSLAYRSAIDINALAYTHQNNVVFGEGQYKPETIEGKRLLAHELVHVVQQRPPGLISRATGDIKRYFEKPTGKFDEDKDTLGFYANQFAMIIGRVLILRGNIADLYDFTKSNNDPGTLIASYKIRPLDAPPVFLIRMYDDTFGICGNNNTELASGGTTSVSTLFGKDTTNYKTLPQKDQKLIDHLDRELKVESWFPNSKDYQDFISKIKSQNFAVIISPVGSTSDRSGGQGQGQDDTPPMPKWMSQYQEEIKNLITKKKKAEPKATDIPDVFRFYYSHQFKKYRATATKKIEHEPVVQVYLDVEEKTPFEHTLEIVRTKIRIKELAEFQISTQKNADSKPPLTDDQLWAMALLLGLRKEIKNERDHREDLYSLPDAISLISAEDSPNEFSLSISVYIKRTNIVTEENTEDKDAQDGETKVPKLKIEDSLEVKTMKLPEPLRKEMTVAGIMPVIRFATTSLREDRRKVEIDPKKEKEKYKKIFAAYPAEIKPLDTREDFIAVKGGKGYYEMEIKYEEYEGTSNASLMIAGMKTVFFRWTKFAVSDFLTDDEYKKITAVTDWKKRRPLINSLLKNKTVRQDSIYKLSGGWDRDREGKVDLPDMEGDFVVYGEAYFEPVNDTYRIPSGAFFPIHIVDGYQLAKEGADAPGNLLKSKKDALAKANKNHESETTIKNIEDEIKALEAVKGRSMIQNTSVTYADTLTALDYAKRIKRILGDKEPPPFDFASQMLKEKDGDKPIGEDVFNLFSKIITEDTRPLSSINKVNWAIKRISDQAEALKGILDRADEFKGETKGHVYSPVTNFVSKTTAKQYNLLMNLAEASDDNENYYTVTTVGGGRADNREVKRVRYPNRTVMLLMDVTSEDTQRSYAGISDNPDKEAAKREATKNAYEKFAGKAAYGIGYVHYKVPGLIDDEGIDILSTPNTWEKVKAVLGKIAAIAGVIALVVGTVATAGALGAASAAIAFGAGAVGIGAGAIGAALAMGNIADRIEGHRIHMDVEFAMDVLNIVGFFASVTKLARLSRLGQMAEEAADVAGVEKIVTSIVRLEKGFMVFQRVETVTNVVLTVYQTVNDLDAIENSDMPEPEKRAMRHAIMHNALLAGFMLAFSVKESLKSAPTFNEEMARLQKNSFNKGKYNQLNKELGLTDADGNWLVPEIKKAAADQQAKFTEAETAKAKTGNKTPGESGQPTTPHPPDDSPANAGGGGGAKVPPDKPRDGGGGGGGGRRRTPKQSALDPESVQAIKDLESKIADLKKRHDAGDIGAEPYIAVLEDAINDIRRNPGSETVTNARDTLADLTTAFPTGTIAEGLPEYYKNNSKKIIANNEAVIQDFLSQAGTWKDAVSFLQSKGKTGSKALDAIHSFRERIVRSLNSDYNAAELPGASNRPESDKDLNFKGKDAGARLIKAEAEMRAKYGDEWSAKLRMNFYTEADRLTMFSRSSAGLPETVRVKLESEISTLSDKLALAKMLKHAEGSEASTARVEKLIETTLPQDAESIRKIAEMPKDEALAMRDALHLEVDNLKQKYDDPETPNEERPVIAANITKKQIEINFFTDEAYISPAALKIILDPNAVLTAQESVSAVLSNLEMMEHIIHEAGGDIALAAKQYELYKYMSRASKSMQKAQTDLYYDQLNKIISQVDREGAKGWSKEQLTTHYNDFIQHTDKFLNETQSKTATKPPEGGSGPGPVKPAPGAKHAEEGIEKDQLNLFGKLKSGKPDTKDNQGTVDKLSIPDDIAVVLKENKIDDLTVKKLLQAGIPIEEVGIYALMPHGIKIAESLVSNGKPMNPRQIRKIIQLADNNNVSEQVGILLENGRLKNPDSLSKLMVNIDAQSKEAARRKILSPELISAEGAKNELKIAADFAVKGNKIELGTQGDLVIESPNGKNKQVLQIKKVYSEEQDKFESNLYSARLQLEGLGPDLDEKPDERPKIGYTRVADITIANEKHPLYNADRATLSGVIKSTLADNTVISKTAVAQNVIKTDPVVQKVVVRNGKYPDGITFDSPDFK